MFEFLEREGSQVLVEPIATWVAYLMYQAKAHAKAKWPANRPHRNPQWWELKKHLANDLGLRKKLMGLGVGEWMWNGLYHRTINHLGGVKHHPDPQGGSGAEAEPLSNPCAVGGEGRYRGGNNV